MKKQYKTFLTLLLQFASTTIVLFVIYIIFALLDIDEVSFENEVGFIIFQPIFGTIITLVTIAACFIVGIPLRFIPKIKAWWISNPYLPVIGLVIGIILLTLSLTPSLMHPISTIIDGEERLKMIPNTAFAVAGWIITGFSLLHFYPISFVTWVKRKVF